MEELQGKMKLTIVDHYPPKADEQHQRIWDFGSHQDSFYMWFMWFANDPPMEIRIECYSTELQEAMREFFDAQASHWPIREADGSEVLYQPGDMVWGWNNLPYFKIRVFLSATLASD